MDEIPQDFRVEQNFTRVNMKQVEEQKLYVSRRIELIEINYFPEFLQAKRKTNGIYLFKNH